MTSGYSGTPLAKKLGIKQDQKLFLKNPPEHYWKLFDVLPEGIQIVENLKPQTVDFIHLFCKDLNQLHKNAQACKKLLKKDGIMWVSWPKGASKIETDLKREPVRDHLLSLGLVDIKVAAIDDDWSGLKFMYRIKDR